MAVGIDSMKRSFARRQAARRAANEARWKQAKQDFDAMVERIAADYDPVRIYCWGSLLQPEKFTDVSDIDIGVEGVPEPERFFELLGTVSAMTEFPVDVVQMEKIDPIHAALIRRKGRVVYERV